METVKSELMATKKHCVEVTCVIYPYTGTKTLFYQNQFTLNQCLWEKKVSYSDIVSLKATEYYGNKKCLDNVNFVWHQDFSTCLRQEKALPEQIFKFLS